MAASFGPGGPILAADQIWRDKSLLCRLLYTELHCNESLIDALPSQPYNLIIFSDKWMSPIRNGPVKSTETRKVWKHKKTILLPKSCGKERLFVSSSLAATSSLSGMTDFLSYNKLLSSMSSNLEWMLVYWKTWSQIWWERAASSWSQAADCWTAERGGQAANWAQASSETTTATFSKNQKSAGHGRAFGRGYGGQFPEVRSTVQFSYKAWHVYCSLTATASDPTAATMWRYCLSLY